MLQAGGIGPDGVRCPVRLQYQRMAFLHVGPVPFDKIGHEALHVERLQTHLDTAALEPRHIEQILGQRDQPLAAPDELFEYPAHPGLVEGAAPVRSERELGHAADRGDRFRSSCEAIERNSSRARTASRAWRYSRALSRASAARPGDLDGDRAVLVAKPAAGLGHE